MKKILLPILVIICISGLAGGLLWYDAHRLDDYMNDPQKGDIYVMYADEVYAPMKIEIVEENQISMVSSLYFFENIVPDRVDIIDSEFDYNTHVTYLRSDLIGMYEDGRIVEIYRD